MFRRIVAGAALALSLASGTPAEARGLSGLLIGVNGILTAPADPFRHVLFPLEDYVDFPGFPYTARALGLVSGSLLAGYRAFMGGVDIALTPLWIVPTLSPEPKIELFIIEPPEDDR